MGIFHIYNCLDTLELLFWKNCEIITINFWCPLLAHIIYLLLFALKKCLTNEYSHPLSQLLNTFRRQKLFITISLMPVQVHHYKSVFFIVKTSLHTKRFQIVYAINTQHNKIKQIRFYSIDLLYQSLLYFL